MSGENMEWELAMVKKYHSHRHSNFPLPPASTFYNYCKHLRPLRHAIDTNPRINPNIPNKPNNPKLHNPNNPNNPHTLTTLTTHE